MNNGYEHRECWPSIDRPDPHWKWVVFPTHRVVLDPLLVGKPLILVAQLCRKSAADSTKACTGQTRRHLPCELSSALMPNGKSYRVSRNRGQIGRTNIQPMQLELSRRGREMEAHPFGSTQRNKSAKLRELAP